MLHGMFSSSGMHPLTFLTIPDSVYRLMTIDSGKPNRKLINYYRQKMIDLVGTKWIPGLNTPLDPLAARLGYEIKTVSLYICRESELDKILSGNLGTFKGTIVSG